jgi:hypothetical protein
MPQPPLPGLQCRHHVQPGRSSTPSIDRSLQQSEQEPQDRSMSPRNPAYRDNNVRFVILIIWRRVMDGTIQCRRLKVL